MLSDYKMNYPVPFLVGLFVPDEESFWFCSVNKTFNDAWGNRPRKTDEPIAGGAALTDGDELRAGDTTFKFRVV